MSPRKPSLPRHVAIIMDGNGRWARKRGLDRVEGHREGARSVRAVVESARRLGIRYLTLYAFSTENWGRPSGEVKALMALLGQYLDDELPLMMKQNIRLRAIGNLDLLPTATRRKLETTMKATKRNSKMDLVLALSYGGRQEILAAVNGLLRSLNGRAAFGRSPKGDSASCLPRHRGSPAAGHAHRARVTEAALRKHFHAPDLPDPDLVIRTSGEYRLSNFLLWQSAYSELYVTRTAWPEFRDREFKTALAAYGDRERRFGLTREQI